MNHPPFENYQATMINGKTSRFVSISKVEYDQPSLWSRYRGGREFLALLKGNRDSHKDVAGLSTTISFDELISCSISYFHIALLIGVNQLTLSTSVGRAKKKSPILVILDRISFDAEDGNTISDQGILQSSSLNQNDPRSGEYFNDHSSPFSFYDNDSPSFDQWLDTPGMFILDMDLSGNKEMDEITSSDYMKFDGSLRSEESTCNEVVSIKLFQYPLNEQQKPYISDLLNYYRQNQNNEMRGNSQRKGSENYSHYMAILRNNQFLSLMTQSGILYLWRYQYESSSWKLVCDQDFYFDTYNQKDYILKTKQCWLDEVHHRCILVEERSRSILTDTSTSSVMDHEIVVKLHEFSLMSDDNFAFSPGIRIISIPLKTNEDEKNQRNLILQMKYIQQEGLLYIITSENTELIMNVYSLLEGKLYKFVLKNELSSRDSESIESLSKVEFISSDYSISNDITRLETDSGITPLSSSMINCDAKSTVNRFCLFLNDSVLISCYFSIQSKLLMKSQPSQILNQYADSVVKIQELFNDDDFAYVCLILENGTVIIQQLSFQKEKRIDDDYALMISSLRLSPIAAKSFKFVIPSRFVHHQQPAIFRPLLPHGSTDLIDNENKFFHVSTSFPLLISNEAVFDFHIEIDISFDNLSTLCTQNVSPMPTSSWLCNHTSGYLSVNEVLRYLFHHVSGKPEQEMSNISTGDDMRDEAVGSFNVSPSKLAISATESYYKNKNQFVFELMQRHPESIEMERSLTNVSITNQSIERKEDMVWLQSLSLVNLRPLPSETFDFEALGKIIDPMVLVELSDSLVESCIMVEDITKNVEEHDSLSGSELTEGKDGNIVSALKLQDFDDNSDESVDDNNNMFFRDVQSDTESDEDLDHMEPSKPHKFQLPSANISKNIVTPIIGDEVQKNIGSLLEGFKQRQSATGPLPFVLRSLLLTHPTQAFDVLNILFDFREALLATHTIWGGERDDWDKFGYDTASSMTLRSVRTQSCTTPRFAKVKSDGEKSSEGTVSNDLEMRSVASQDHSVQFNEEPYADHVDLDSHDHSLPTDNGEAHFHDVQPSALASFMSSSEYHQPRAGPVKDHDVSPLQEILMYKVMSQSNQKSNGGILPSLTFGRDDVYQPQFGRSKLPKYDDAEIDHHVHLRSGSLDLNTTQERNSLEESALQFHAKSLVTAIFNAHFTSNNKLPPDVLCGFLLKSLPQDNILMQNMLLKMLVRCGAIAEAASWLIKLNRTFSLTSLAIRLSATVNFLNAENVRWQAILEWSASRQKRERLSLSKILNQQEPILGNNHAPDSSNRKDDALLTFQGYFTRISFFFCDDFGVRGKKRNSKQGTHRPKLELEKRLPQEYLVFFDRYYHGADAVVVVNGDREKDSDESRQLWSGLHIKGIDMSCRLFSPTVSISHDAESRSPDDHVECIIKNDFSFYSTHLESLNALIAERTKSANQVFFATVEHILSKLCNDKRQYHSSQDWNLKDALTTLLVMRPISLQKENFLKFCSNVLESNIDSEIRSDILQWIDDTISRG